MADHQSDSEDQTLVKLRDSLPGITFKPGDVFAWSPAHLTVTYCHIANDQASIWALFHEAGHAALRHKNYYDDIDLLQKEVAAWEKAKELAVGHDVEINENHVQDCLDTYRDWLHQRSTCPNCGNISLQTSSREYKCHNCDTVWQVSDSRMCRPYRLRKSASSGKNKKPSEDTLNPQTTFR